MNRFVHYFLVIALCLPSLNGGLALALTSSDAVQEAITTSGGHQHSHHQGESSQASHQSQSHVMDHDCCDEDTEQPQMNACCEGECEGCSNDCSSNLLALVSAPNGVSTPVIHHRVHAVTSLPDAPTASAIIPPIK